MESKHSDEVRTYFFQMINDLALKPGDRVYLSQILYWFNKNSILPQFDHISDPRSVYSYLSFFSTNSINRARFSQPTPQDDLFFIDSRWDFRYHIFDKENDPPPFIAVTHAPREFAYEYLLRDYLAMNLEHIEPGMRLYQDVKGRPGIEYPTDNRFIDILAVDVSNNFVVIETKVSRGHQAAIGQIQNYMGWVKENLCTPEKKVRGMIVASEISNDLRQATLVNEVELFEYKLSVSVQVTKFRK